MLENKKFLYFSCVIIFLLSIFLRSLIDIGADTAVYIDLGQKIAEGKKYFSGFFESNFPFSFYLYALEYHASKALHINPIIFSEIIINILALLSIFYSAKILKETTFDKKYYNLILISYFLGFFLRPFALTIGEFGTKTSLLLITFYPYLSFSFERQNLLTKSQLIQRGILMGLIPCIKPQYILLIAAIEFYKFLQKKNFLFFFQTDKLAMYLTGAIYLHLMLRFTPDFFIFMVPMWQKFYSAYDNLNLFLSNTLIHFSARILVFIFIFLIFAYKKPSENDKILIASYIGASLLLIAESAATIDQITIFYAIITITYLKLAYDFFTMPQFIFDKNKFITLCLFFIPLFDLEILPAAIFGLGGFANSWWLLAFFLPFIFRKNLNLKKITIAIFIYILAALCAVLAIKNNGWLYITFNLSLLFLLLFFFEKKNPAQKFSSFTNFMIMAAIASLLYSYIISIANIMKKDDLALSPSPFSDARAYYINKFADKKSDGVIAISNWIVHQFPLIKYLNKENYQTFHIASTQASAGNGNNKMMFSGDKMRAFTFSYLFDDLKQQLKNKNIKVIFVNNDFSNLEKSDRCLIGSLEYYFLDYEFRKLFFENFHFENRVIIEKTIKPISKIKFYSKEKPDVFDNVKPATKKTVFDFEVYVRK